MSVWLEAPWLCEEAGRSLYHSPPGSQLIGGETQSLSPGPQAITGLYSVQYSAVYSPVQCTAQQSRPAGTGWGSAAQPQQQQQQDFFDAWK